MSLLSDIVGRSCGFYINSTRHSGNTYGSGFFGESWHTCSNNYTVLFGCTNTTYTDENGNPEGDTIFLLTDCMTNERLTDGQDPRYVFDEDADGDPEPSQPSNLTVQLSDTIQPFERQDPDGWRTCERGCLCGYSQLLQPFSTIEAPYDACDCHNVLTPYFFTCSSNRIIVPISSENLTLLQFYGAIPCNATAGPGSSGNFSNEYGIFNVVGRVWVPDSVGNKTLNGTMKPLTNPYECFGSFDSMGGIMRNYTYQQNQGSPMFSDGVCSQMNY